MDNSDGNQVSQIHASRVAAARIMMHRNMLSTVRLPKESEKRLFQTI